MLTKLADQERMGRKKKRTVFLAMISFTVWQTVCQIVQVYDLDKVKDKKDLFAFNWRETHNRKYQIDMTSEEEKKKFINVTAEDCMTTKI